MQKKKIILIGVLVAVASLMWSCEDSGEATPEINDQNFVTDNILLGSNSALNRLRSNGFGGPMGALYGGYTTSQTQGRSASPKPHRIFGNHNIQTAQLDDSDCMIESWTHDGNGNYTYILDFGDGCSYYGSWMFGKMIDKGSWTETGFSSSITYENFGGGVAEGDEDWLIDGTYRYSGSWEEVEADNPESDTTWYYNAAYEFEADLTQKYTEYHWNEDSTDISIKGETVVMDYEADGSESMDNEGYTVHSKNEKVVINETNFITNTVSTPLFLDYSCESVWIFVSGIESGNYEYEGAIGSYRIDYGNGSCDNIIHVTENGVTEEIDMGEVWVGWCGTEG